MAATKITALTELASAFATGDLLCLVDVSDTTMDAAGTNKKVTLGNLFQNLPGPIGLDAQTFLHSPAANVLSLRNSTNAQSFRVHNTWTDASNNEYGGFSWNSNVLEIGSFKNGTGSARNVRLMHGGSQKALVSSAGFTVVGELNGNTSSVMKAWLWNVVNDTSSGTQGAGEQMAVLTNAGAGAGITTTLLSGAAGCPNFFVDNNATHRLTIVPNTGDQIVWTDGTIVSAATGSVVSTARYNSFWGIWVDTTSFVVFGATGTWTVTP